jgi:hypothetical protein
MKRWTSETEYQAYLKKRIKERIPGCIVYKEPAEEIQGIPDLIVLYGDRWASLEVKKSKDEPHRPNQDYYVDKMNKMSFSAFIFPENKEAVLDELEQSFSRRSRRRSCLSRSK